MAVLLKTIFGLNFIFLVSSSSAFARTDLVMLNVDKKSLKAELRTLPEDIKTSQVLKAFRIAIGKSSGDKIKEGDNKTPEGIYFVQKPIEDGSLPAKKYGPLAIPLNFPNPFDQLQGKTGYGIWLHGAGEDKRIEEKNVTEGCVAFFNSEITRLANWLRPYQGIVTISEDASTVNREADLVSARAVVDTWTQSWQQRNVDGYIGQYDSAFHYEGKDLKAYRDYKERVFKSYKEMSVKIDSLRVVTHPKYALAVMNQDFKGDSRFVSNGRKVLYLAKDSSNRWRIVREHFDSQHIKPIEFGEKELSELNAVAQSLSSAQDENHTANTQTH